MNIILIGFLSFNFLITTLRVVLMFQVAELKRIHKIIPCTFFNIN